MITGVSQKVSFKIPVHQPLNFRNAKNWYIETVRSEIQTRVNLELLRQET